MKTSTNDIYANTIQYSDSTLAQVGTLIGTICASTLPVLAIVVLYYIHSMGGRLAAIAGFTSIFSAILGIFSNSRRVEIFAATAGLVYSHLKRTMTNAQIGLLRFRWCLLARIPVIVRVQKRSISEFL
jgi:hypothetical protein